MLPRVVYSMLLACAFGACSEDEPKCVCKPVMRVEMEPANQHLCNNATFHWMIQTMLEEISTLKDNEVECQSQAEKLKAHSQDSDTRYQQLQESNERTRQNLSQCQENYDHLMAENVRLAAELRILTAEVERQRSHPHRTHIPRDCSDIQHRGSRYSGLYTIYPEGVSNGMEAFCDLDTDGGGWTVIQRRQDGTQRFDRSWETYKAGFGQLAREFWLGNEYIHLMTSGREYELRVDMLDFDGNHAYASYDRFSLDSESQAYTLRLGTYEGTAGDALGHHKDHGFSTKDVDNDLSRSGHCSQLFGNGGWWFVRCYDSNLNGVYRESADQDYKDGIIWYQLTTSHQSLLHVEMKIRPRGFSRTI